MFTAAAGVGLIACQWLKALEATAREVFEVIREGKVKVEIRHAYPLAEAERVHRDLEGHRTVGSIVMIP
jgi:NADPH:quinone reductase